MRELIYIFPNVAVGTLKMQNLRWIFIMRTAATRKASNYKRPQMSILANAQLDTLRTDLQSRSEMSAGDWRELQETLIRNYKHINKGNVDAIILGACNKGAQLPQAKGYVQFLRGCGVEPNVASLGRLLRVYNQAYRDRGLSEQEQREILDICEHIKSKHPVLDATSCENLIRGLVGTNEWRQCTQLLDMMRLSAALNVTVYSELAAKAFSMGDMRLGWTLLEEMLEQQKQPRCDVFRAYLHEIEKPTYNFLQEFEKLLKFLEKYEVVITEAVAKHMEDLSELRSKEVQVSWTRIDRLGRCRNCANPMQNISISEAEFSKLRDAFFEKVLVGGDIFHKSTPREVEQFRNYVAQTAPYDCVIDGLNVAYSTGDKKPPAVLANLVASVVKHFNARNKDVLVLGRKHMNHWPKETMQYIRKNASVFLTNNLTHDDPFLLYATLTSGQNTDFFSRDLMRSHAFLLGPELKPIFRRWQQEHQFSLVTQVDSGRIIVKEPIRHRLCAHKVKNTWHLPCKVEYAPHQPDSFEIPQKWLCVQLQDHRCNKNI